MYIFIARSSLEPASAPRVLSLAAGARSSDFDFVPLEGVSVGGVSIEGKVIRLVGIMFPDLILFSCLPLVFHIIGSGSIEFTRIGAVLFAAMNWLLNFDRVGNVALLVLGFIIELGSVGVIGITRLIVRGFALLTLIVGPVSRLEEIRIVLILVESVCTLVRSFN